MKNIFLGVFSFLGLPRARAVILMYHSVSDEREDFFNVHPQEFENQMDYIARTGLNVITLTELSRRLRARESLGGAIVITFDDGYRDNYTAAFPVLSRQGFPATIFLTSDLIGSSDKRGAQMLSIEEIHSMHDSNLIEFAPHTKTHPKLSHLTSEEMHREIEGSKLAIEAIINEEAKHFAYPYGNYSEETVSIVKELQFTAAVSVREGTVSHTSDPYQLPRVSIDKSTNMLQLKGKITRAVDIYEFIKSYVS